MWGYLMGKSISGLAGQSREQGDDIGCVCLRFVWQSKCLSNLCSRLSESPLMDINNAGHTNSDARVFATEM